MTPKSVAVARRVVAHPGMAIEVCYRLGDRALASRHQRRVHEYEPVAELAELADMELSSAHRIHQSLGSDSFARLKKELEMTELPGGYHNRSGAAYLELYYATVRALQPQMVLETGVGVGYGSAAILQAMEDNGTGRLVSIDLPSFQPGANKYQGVVVPHRLRTERWDLRTGPDRREIPRLIPQIDSLDLIFYDSDKSYKGMMRTWTAVWPKLRRGGLLVADDIQDNDAFLVFGERVRAAPFLLKKPTRQALYPWESTYLVGLMEK